VRKYKLKLYVTGKTLKSERALAKLMRICDEDLDGTYEIVTIDLLEHPELAEDEKIIALPVVIKELPRPIRRVIGDLSDTESVLLGLDLEAIDPEPPGEDLEPVDSEPAGEERSQK